MRAILCSVYNISKHYLFPPERVRSRIAEHFMEEGRNEGGRAEVGLHVQLLQLVGLVQEFDYPLLFY
jgi:hypothetical protein